MGRRMVDGHLGCVQILAIKQHYSEYVGMCLLTNEDMHIYTHRYVCVKHAYFMYVRVSVGYTPSHGAAGSQL